VSVTAFPDFTFKMVYSKAKLKNSGDKASVPDHYELEMDQTNAYLY
jgi:hypothetical protein